MTKIIFIVAMLLIIWIFIPKNKSEIFIPLAQDKGYIDCKNRTGTTTFPTNINGIKVEVNCGK